MNPTLRKFFAALLVAFGVFCLIKGLPSSVSHDAANGVMPGAVASIHSERPVLPTAAVVKTRAIQEIKVGQRVIARNPEISNLERRTRRAEPDFSRWLQLSLELPKPDGTTLHIEMLRSEEWLRQQIGFVIGEIPDPSGERQGVSPPSTTHDVNLTSPKPENLTPKTAAVIGHSNLDIGHCPLSPLRPIFYDIQFASIAAEAEGVELLGLTVELDLPEMGACGTAIISGISTTPEIEQGEGQVVTATFRHPPSNTVLDVVFVDEGTSLDHPPVAAGTIAGESVSSAECVTAQSSQFDTESKPIGVTNNHLFWSEDRGEFIEIGRMEIGERVRTLFGETKILAQKLPRPGPPAEVYNLEVHEEHVYFVGDDAVLAHNTYDGRKAIALGISGNDGTKLANFAGGVRGVPWWSWKKQGLTSMDPRRLDVFPDTLVEAATNARHIHFNLDGFSIQKALSGSPDWLMKHVTDMEFRTLLQTDDFLQKTTFHLRGQSLGGVEFRDILRANGRMN